MTQRERTMATVLGVGVVVLVVGGGSLIFYNAFANSQNVIEGLERDIADNQAKIDKVIKNRAIWERWRQLSNGFPDTRKPPIAANNLDLIKSTYREYLENSFRDYGLTAELFPEVGVNTPAPITHPGRSGKVPIYTGINFANVKLKARLGNLISFLQDFQKQSYMHRITKLTIERSNSAKDGDYLTVTMSFEHLTILDAEKVTKRANLPGKEFLAMDAALGFRMAFPGMGAYWWWLSPLSPSVKPLNELSTARRYDDIPQKNFFTGPVAPSTGGTTTTTTKDKGPKQGARWPDEMINMMRFNRLVTMTVDADGTAEAGLWDMYFNQRLRLRARGGFDSFRLIQTGKGDSIIQAKVVKVENNDIIFRVNMKAAEPQQSAKWWRYPDGEKFFVVHDEDVDTLIKAKKATAADKGKLYLLNMPYWEKLTVKGASKLDVSVDKKSFRYVGKALGGDIVDADWSTNGVVIVRFANGASPPKTAEASSISSKRVYPKEDQIYRVQFKHFDDLVVKTNKTAASKKGNNVPLKKEDLDRVFAIPTTYWDVLLNQRVVTTQTTGGRSDFRFYHELMCGEIIDWNDEMVVIRMWEQYCKCPADPDRNIAERGHEGFLVLPLERYVADALQSPLPESRLGEFLPSAAKTTETKKKTEDTKKK